MRAWIATLEIVTLRRDACLLAANQLGQKRRFPSRAFGPDWVLFIRNCRQMASV